NNSPPLGNDTHYGGAGNDTMLGRSDPDRFFGDSGADLFQFLNGETSLGAGNRIRIGDFAAKDGDRLDLHLIDADTLAGGDQAFIFIGTAAFSAPGQLRFAAGTGFVVLQASIDGDTAAEFAAELTGLTTVQAGWLVL
ncbi:MAG: hypothetical protein U1E14_21490, partial [Geminicoccaceae bacterium]